MIVTCNAEYWKYMESMKPEGAPCGKTYDDVDHSTICPHPELPAKLTLDELQRLSASMADAPPAPDPRDDPPALPDGA